MGAQDFEVTSTGKTAAEAFAGAVRQAAYDYGHSGYTGTIAEKDDFTMARPKPVPRDEVARVVAEIVEADTFGDKWGPAGCVEVADSADEDGVKEFVFFGWASS